MAAQAVEVVEAAVAEEETEMTAIAVGAEPEAGIEAEVMPDAMDD